MIDKHCVAVESVRLLVALTLSALPACVSAPDTIYLVDNRTALEQQAAGSHRPIEAVLEAELLRAQPAPFTSAELAAGDSSAGGDARSLASTWARERDDRESLEDLLVRGCIGESDEGLLILSTETCRGTIDEVQVSQLIQRANRNRIQLWSWLARQSGRTLEDVRAAWRVRHLEQLVCGARYQQEDGSWQLKRC